MRRTTITQRWILNSVGLIFVILLGIVISVSLFIKNYYYNSAKQFMITRMNMISSALQTSYNENPAKFSQDLRKILEDWNEKEKMELMVIDSKGKVAITSSGFIPEIDTIMYDYADAVENGISGNAIGRISTGEHIMAICVVIPPNKSGYTAVRVVSSLDEIDKQIYMWVLALIVISFSILVLMFFSGSYFIKSIVIPVRQLNNTAKRYAVGDFSMRISKKKDDEIGELCDTINHMAEELAISENMKNDFISSVSHELRTPLTAIKGWAETIAYMPDDEESVSKGMRVIAGETERLSQMVEELLDFSRMQNGKFSLQKMSMDILAELGDAVLIYDERAKREGIEIIYDEPDMLPFIYGDRNRIRQVFINVIDNAIKYSDNGGRVLISALMPNATHIEIDISDTGCGISEHDLPKIKTKFYKANHTRRGSGIGLAVADEIITMHNGKLNVFSEQGVGTTVSITLPIEIKS